MRSYLRPLSYSARFHEGERMLYVSSKRGLRRINAQPLTAEIYDLRRSQPGWRCGSVRLDFNRLFHRIAAARRTRARQKPFCGERFFMQSAEPSSSELEMLRTASALKRFISHVGLTTCREVRCLPAGIHFWSVYCLHRLGVPLDDLLRWNPSLFVALCSHVRLHFTRDAALDELRALCQQPFRTIARTIGYPSANFLRRIAPGALTSGRLRMLRRVCLSRGDSRARRVLSHLPLVGATIIELVCGAGLYPEHISSSFLMDLAKSDSDPAQPRLAKRVAALFRFLRACGIGHLPRLWALDQFEDLYGEIMQHEGLGEDWELNAISFPPPPFEEPGFIEGIRDSLHLAGEAIQMDNCVRMYAGAIAKGDYYAYRILGTWGMTRATMVVRRDTERPSLWRLDEVNGKHGKAIPKACYASLLLWLCERQYLQDESLVRAESEEIK